MKSATDPVASSPSVEQAIVRLLRLQETGSHEEVLREAHVLLGDVPENRDVLLAAAVSLRHLGRISDAFEMLDRLECVRPRSSLLHRERGLCHVQLRDAGGAIRALEIAVQINPASLASWRMLEGLYRLVGDGEKSDQSAGHIAQLESQPPDLVRAMGLFSDGELALAEQLTRALLLRDGDNIEGMRLLARIAMANDVLYDAELLLATVVGRLPDYIAARHEYAETLIRRQKYQKAYEEARRLLALHPKNGDYRSLAASAAIGLGKHDEAILLYRAIIADWPDYPDVYLWLGHALKTIGRTPEAIVAYRQAVKARPDFGDAFWSLANLKSYRFTEEEVSQMRGREAAAETNLDDRIHLCFALGKALEDRGEFGESWRFYATGNELQHSKNRYRPGDLEAEARQERKVCTQAFFQERTGWGSPAVDPIFIIGLPRSGSTLVEQILASHSQVEGTHELAEIQRIVFDLRERDPSSRASYPEVLEGLTEDDALRLGELYLRDTRAYRTGRLFFVDKMPNNFRHVGLIHMILPNAKIIDVRREPISCCFSNLKQLFARGQEFTYSSEDIARYYRMYLDLMRHWDSVLPAGRIFRVHYEDLVDDLDPIVRRLLDYCKLPFERACTQFYKTQRSIMTPSSEQVRQPVFSSSVEHWKNYEPWLGQLKHCLGEAWKSYRN